jgi:hypothetical protein
VSYEACVSYRKGAIKPVYGKVSALYGQTLTIQSGGTFSLYDNLGNIALGPVAVTGYDSTPLQTANIWYVLSTAGLNAAEYYGLFSFPVLGADSIVRTELSDVQIIILPIVEIIATYDDTGLMSGTNVVINQVRLALSDTNPANAIWSDAEILYWYSAGGGTVLIAAALALEALAVDKAKLANAIQIGSYGNGESEVYKAVVERAAQLRAVAVAPIINNDVCPIFTIGQPGDQRPGSMDFW